MKVSVGNKVVLIGAGDVGLAYSYALINQGVCDHLAIIDIDEKKLEGNVMDLNHGVVWAPSRTKVTKGTYEDCADAALVVICAGAAQKPGETRLQLVDKNMHIMKSIVDEVMSNGFDGIFLVASNPVDILTYAVWQYSGLDWHQVVGSGTVLDTSRLRYLVSRETGVATQNIHAYVAGEHGDSEVALWSSAEIGNVPLSQWGPTLSGRVFDAELRKSIATDVVQSAYKIIEGKGATNYAIGLSASNIAGAVLRDEQRVLTVSTLLEDWEGISDVCMAAPTLVGRDGAGRVLNPPLTLNERDGLTASAERLRKVARDLGF